MPSFKDLVNCKHVLKSFQKQIDTLPFIPCAKLVAKLGIKLEVLGDFNKEGGFFFNRLAGIGNVLARQLLAVNKAALPLVKAALV